MVYVWSAQLLRILAFPIWVAYVLLRWIILLNFFLIFSLAKIVFTCCLHPLAPSCHRIKNKLHFCYVFSFHFLNKYTHTHTTEHKSSVYMSTKIQSYIKTIELERMKGKFVPYVMRIRNKQIIQNYIKCRMCCLCVTNYMCAPVSVYLLHSSIVHPGWKKEFDLRKNVIVGCKLIVDVLLWE